MRRFRRLFCTGCFAVAAVVGTVAVSSTASALSSESMLSPSSAPKLGRLRIVAAGRGRSMCLPPIRDAVLRLAGKERPRLLYLGTATYDETDAFEAQTQAYRNRADIVRLDVSERCITIPSQRQIEDTISSADIILVSGGNTLYAVNRWKQLGMDDMIRRSGTVLCGGSAGAIVCFEHGHSDSMDPTTFLNVDPNLTEEQKKSWKYIRVDGLGLLPRTLCVPHYDATQSNGLPRSQDSDAMMMLEENRDLICVGIDENAALLIDDGVVRVVGGDTGAASEQCHVKVLVPGLGNTPATFFHRAISSATTGVPVDDFLNIDFWRKQHGSMATT